MTSKNFELPASDPSQVRNSNMALREGADYPSQIPGSALLRHLRNTLAEIDLLSDIIEKRLLAEKLVHENALVITGDAEIILNRAARRELVDKLSAMGFDDLAQQVAGYDFLRLAPLDLTRIDDVRMIDDALADRALSLEEIGVAHDEFERVRRQT